MNRKERLELIDRFLTREMSDLEREQFNSHLEENSDLRKELKVSLELMDVVDPKSEYNSFKRLIQEAELNYFGQPKQTNQNWRLAAVISLLLVAGVIGWMIVQTQQEEDYFADHFEHYEMPDQIRGRSLDEALAKEQMDTAFVNGWEDYNDKNYKAAARRLELAAQGDSTNYTARFLLGVSYLALREFDQAEPVLKALSEDSSHVFQKQAQEYLELLHKAKQQEARRSSDVTSE